MGLSCKERIFMVLLGVATASGLTVLVLLLVEATSVLLPAETKFGIVLDAGSSHTSLFVYQWPSDKEKDTGVVSQALACQVEGQRAAPGRAWRDRRPVRGQVVFRVARLQYRAGLDLGPPYGTLTAPPTAASP